MEKKTKTACFGFGGGGGDDQISFLLPEDFLIQILVRLPVISLLRFKSVCKSWLTLIQTTYFIDLHATTSNSSSKFGTFILRASQYHGGSLRPITGFHMLSSDQYESKKSEEEESELYGDDWYWGADGTWHKLTEEEESEYGDWYWGADGTWHKLTSFVVGGEGGDWHWDITNCVWYWVPDDDDDEADNDHQVFKFDDDDDQLVLKLDYIGLPSIPKLDYTELPQILSLESLYKLRYSQNLSLDSLLDKLRYSETPIGSCNGLICLYNSYLKVFSLWNPATRQFRRLPKSITMETLLVNLVLFGFDVETKDYKVLMAICYPKRCGQQLQLEEYFCQAEVYSLSTDSWRVLEGINSMPGVPSGGHCGLYLNNGTCYFMANTTYPERHRFIISYNFTKEIFTKIQLPDHDNSRKLFLCCLGGEKMALFTTLPDTTSSSPSSSSSSSSSYGCEDYGGSQDCDIWVLNEHGGGGVNKESWNKLHSFIIDNGTSYGLTILRGISNDGKFALLETGSDLFRRRMLVYNFVTREAITDFLICERLSEVYVFKPSLVSIIGGNGAAANPAIE